MGGGRRRGLEPGLLSGEGGREDLFGRVALRIEENTEGFSTYAYDGVSCPATVGRFEDSEKI